MARKQLDLSGAHARLPQSVWLEAGHTSGTVEVRVAALRKGVIEARGSAQGTLSRSRPPPSIPVKLTRLCLSVSDGGTECGCMATASCGDAGFFCGKLDDGCGGTMDCGSCPAPLSCGFRAPNVCSDPTCKPQCTTCGQIDPLCGELCTTGWCGSGQYCDAGSCACPAGQTDCSGKCVSLRNDSRNCGSCGHSCPNNKACTGGMCLCTEPSDNSDGHCCPVGMSFLSPWAGTGPYCYLGPRGPADFPSAKADCRAAIGMACVGAALASDELGVAVPKNTCGSYLVGRTLTVNPWVGNYLSNYSSAGTSECQPACDAGCQCSCSDSYCYGCVQRYYCVLDPLGPRAAPCISDWQCPPGMACDGDGGACQPSGKQACCSRSECDDKLACKARGQFSNDAVTGYCQ